MNGPRGFRFLFKENEVTGDFVFEIDPALGALCIWHNEALLTSAAGISELSVSNYLF